MLNFKPFPILETTRLKLTQASKSDAKQILFLRSDPKINQYVKRPLCKSLEEASAFVERIDKGIENNQNLYWKIALKENPEMIGSISLWQFSDDLKTAEVGYDLSWHHHNKGFMSEALLRVLTFGFLELGFEHIEAYTQYDNEASVKILERVGMQKVADRKDEGNPHNRIYTVAKDRFLEILKE